MAMTAQQSNALSREVQAAQKLFETIFELKKNRASLDSLGVAGLTDDDYKAAGELDHLTRQRIKSVLAAMDLFDTLLLTPVNLDGVTIPPIKALVDVIR